MPFRPKIKKALTRILGKNWVKDDPVTRYAYRCDGLTLHTALPLGVVYPASTAELVEIVKLFHAETIAFLPRGAGTGLSGGAVPKEGSVIIEMVRFDKIHAIDPENRTITVGPGVVNLAVSEAARPHGLHFAPDPSSQKACTVGGNVGENSGGPHTLKYGVTVNHVLGMEVVLADGSLIQLGGEVWGTPGPDLLGLLIGTEGTLAIVSKIICRLTPLPERVITMLGVFSSTGDASRTVSGIIRRGMIPAALEMIDRVVIQAVERTLHPGFPLDAAAVLIIELEDLNEGMDEEAERIREICLENNAREVRRARDEAERALIWRARKEALGALGSISPCFYTQDGVIPRSALPIVLDQISAIGEKYGLIIANVFHAGDGNLHPLILYDGQNVDQIEKVHRAGEEILEICLEQGGALSGEHGIGLEKSDMMARAFRPEDLANMREVHAAFNPKNLLNPGKIFPSPARCSETKIVRTKSGILV